ncbi:hypothetical protein [Paraburkholderia piptadeniae]|uniref:hypothetical protein n=1 Tax=Paraburkholderia piptadeniae TaxID=1701573 RepID=UPI0011816AC8|nr:hypothetical protein [Paraburkholderia piptadeniae]
MAKKNPDHPHRHIECTPDRGLCAVANAASNVLVKAGHLPGQGDAAIARRHAFGKKFGEPRSIRERPLSKADETFERPREGLVECLKLAESVQPRTHQTDPLQTLRHSKFYGRLPRQNSHLDIRSPLVPRLFSESFAYRALLQ